MYDVINYTDCSREQLLEILNLRNMDGVRRWMVNQEVISDDSHFRFAETLRDNADRRYYAVYRDGRLVGTYNLTREDGGVWERGIVASPATQGRGETEQWERQILAGLPHQGIRAVSAKVRLDNARSIRYHAKLGFREQRRDSQYIYYILHLDE